MKVVLRLLLAGAMACAVTPLFAGVDVDLGGVVRIGDDAALFVGISSHYFDRDQREVERWGAHYRDRDDLAVALFIAGRTRQSPDAIWALRRNGRSWWQIAVHFGMPADALFVPVRRHPGPPYGNAYGHWKKHKRDHRHAVVLSDADVRNLVAVRMIHEYYRVSVDVAMEWRASGRNLEALMNDEYRRRHGGGHGKAKSKAHKASHKPGKGHGRR